MPESDFFFGWDLLYKSIETKVDKKSDVLISLVHFVLIKYAKFRCIGVGEDKTLLEDTKGSELLPVGWNDNDKKYALRYVNGNQLYLLLGHKSEESFIINLIDVKTKNVSNIALVPDTVVAKTFGSIEDIIPTASHVVDRLIGELVKPVFSGNTKEATTQTTTSTSFPESDRDPLRISGPMRPSRQIFPGGLEQRPFGFPDVGRGDLDPLGRGPGSILQFPPRPNFAGQPRFDPFGPPDPNVRPNPNPDHFPPPSFGGSHYYM